jgi:hypothetical protein
MPKEGEARPILAGSNRLPNYSEDAIVNWEQEGSDPSKEQNGGGVRVELDDDPVSQGSKGSKLSYRVRIIIISVLNVVINVMAFVAIPIYTGTMDNVKGDAYVVLFQSAFWFVLLYVLMSLVLKYTVDRSITLRPTASLKILFVMGFLTTLNGIMVVYASPPNRTPPYLQAVLGNIVIPYTVIFRVIILKKGKSSLWNK